ncbi:MAG: hypothetical protein JXK94_05605 [Deltaproteobacteria bacterium]|nr:hypothetical protein [Deltaproteobacteria bacterium]
MERASAARMAAAKPHGRVHAALGMSDAKHCAGKLNNYPFSSVLSRGKEIIEPHTASIQQTFKGHDR